MNTFQLIMVGLAAFLAVPVLINKLYAWTSSGASVEPPPVEGDSLVDVIDCWERLQKLCEGGRGGLVSFISSERERGSAFLRVPPRSKRQRVVSLPSNQSGP